MSTRNRNITPNPDALELGFPGALQFEGAMIYSEIECPADTAYGLNIDEMELRLLSDDLMDAEGPTWDQKSQSYLFTVAGSPYSSYTFANGDIPKLNPVS